MRQPQIQEEKEVREGQKEVRWKSITILLKRSAGGTKKKPMFIVRTLFDGLFVVADVFQYLEENEM